jgi:hypothetical protein
MVLISNSDRATWERSSAGNQGFAAERTDRRGEGRMVLSVSRKVMSLPPGKGNG